MTAFRPDLKNHIALEGVEDVRAALDMLSAADARKVSRFALTQVARSILKQAKANVPVNERRLRNALNVKVDRGTIEPNLLLAMIYVSNKKSKYRPRKTNRKSRIKGKLVPRRYDYQIGSKPNVYGAFLEFGAPHHNIAPNPFMRRAWEQAGGETAVRMFTELLGPAITILARKRGFQVG